MEMAAYGKEHPERTVRGILVFTTAALDPKTSPWYHDLNCCGEGLKVVYLDDFLKKLEKEHPDHPLPAVFKPWQIQDAEILRKNAKIWWKKIERGEADEAVKAGFEAVFIRWMQERFSTLSYEEVIKMFADMTPLEETRSYKEIFAKGEAKGEVKGRYETIREELERLRLLRSQNVLTQGLFEILSGPLKRELIYLEQLNSKDHKI
jgi:hypothetical protein